MPFLRKTSVTYRDHILEALRDDIVAGRLPAGSKMPALRTLSGRFHASLFPIRQAMMQLEAEGYVVRRHGSGIYVLPRPPAFQMTDSVVLCMNATGHVYEDLSRFLLDQLHDLGLFASVLDLAHGNCQELLQRGLLSEARFLIFQAGFGFPWDMLPAAAARKHLIAVLNYESHDPALRVHRIIVDHAAGNRLLTAHLWKQGHRRLVFTGPPDMIERASAWNGRGVCEASHNVPGAGLAALWARRGGHVIPFHSYHDDVKGPQCDELQLLSILRGPAAPTAIVGVRDVDAWDIRDVLHRRAPDVLQRLEFFGNGDTPWSRTAHPPFTTLSWNLSRIAELTGQLIRDLMAGQTLTRPVTHSIPSRLEVRGELRRTD